MGYGKDGRGASAGRTAGMGVSRRTFVALASAATAAVGVAGANGALATSAASPSADTQTFTAGGLRYKVLAEKDIAPALRAASSSSSTSSGKDSSAAGDTTADAADSASSDGTTSSSRPMVCVGTGTQPGGTGVGDGAEDTSAESIEIPATVTHEGTTYDVVQIAPYAFQYHPLRSVTLPEGLLWVGKGAFQFCRSLEEVAIPSSVTLVSTLAFFAASSLASVTFAEDAHLAELGDGAFAIMKTPGSVDNDDLRASLASIDLPASLTRLGSYAFYGQSQLASVTFGCSELQSISPYSFGQCTSLTRIDIPTLTSENERIGRGAFENDTSLTTVTFSGGVTGMQRTQAGNEFAGCTGITTVIYHDKKWNATNYGMNPTSTATSASIFGGSFSFGTGGFTDSPDAKEYYTVRQYAGEQDALAGGDPTGTALVLAGTPLHEVCAASCDFLEKDEGFAAGAWAWEDATSVAGGISDSLFCWPCDASDLTYGGISPEADLNEDGEPQMALTQAADVTAQVWDAAGNELTPGTDYSLAFDGGTPGSAGSYVLVATGAGSYQGQTSCQVIVTDDAARWIRLAADDWKGAMQLASQAAFENASTATTPCNWAVVAAGGADHLVDALPGCALAGALGGVLLLTEGQGLSSETSYEINRVGVSNVVVLGDTDAVSQDAEDALSLMYAVGKVYRIAGTGKEGQATDMRVATLAKSLGVTWGDTCLVAGTGDLAAAACACAWSYATAAPLIWAGSGTGDLSADMADALAQAGISRAVILGDESAVSAASAQALTEAGIDPERVTADGRDSLAEAVGARMLELGCGVDGTAVFPADHPELAVGAAALAGKAFGSLLTADCAGQVLTGRGSELERGYVVGSESLVGADEISALEALA